MTYVKITWIDHLILYQITLQVVLVLCELVLLAVWSDHWQLNQFPYQAFLLKRGGLKNKTCQ